VFLRREGEERPRLWARDLTADDVRRRLVAPYRKGGALVQGGEIIPVNELRAVRIARTDVPFQQAYAAAHVEDSRRTAELNRESGIYFISPGPGHDDMVNEWPDVTAEFLKGKPPWTGAKSGWWVAITNNRFLSSLVVGLILAAVYMYFGVRRP
jgi:hypothetical protein